jgi:hypothetical protein
MAILRNWDWHAGTKEVGSMVRLTARNDGKVLVPDGPVNLPQDVPLTVVVEAGDNGNQVDPILAICGLGAELWKGIDALEYQRREREGWG